MEIKDLEFKRHPSNVFGGERCVVDFDNGYSASVITGGGAYTSHDKPYEIAVMWDGSLDYTTPITDDVLGHLTTDDANKVLADIEALPPFTD